MKNGSTDNRSIKIKKTVYGNGTAKTAEKTAAGLPVTRKNGGLSNEFSVTVDRAPKAKEDEAKATSPMRYGYTYTEMTDNEELRREIKNSGVKEFKEKDGLRGIYESSRNSVRIKTPDNIPCFGNITVILVFAVVLCLVAASYSEYHAAYSNIKSMEASIESYRAEQKKLKMAIEERDNFEVEMKDYAVNVLGMVKEESLTKHYAAAEAVDRVVVRNQEEREATSGGILLSGFKSIISKIFFDSES